MNGVISMNGRAVGRIFGVSYREPTTNCEVIEIPVASLVDDEVTFTRAEVWDKEAIELIQGKRNFFSLGYE